MAKQDINIGATPGDGTGDVVREAFRKSKENFDELYNRATGDMNKSVYDPDNDGSVASADKLKGVDTASNNTFYGKDGAGNDGFFPVTATAQAPITDYADFPTLYADQGNQTLNYIYYVTGEGYYQYLGTTAGNINDYRKVYKDSEVVKSVNGQTPDVNGDVTVSGSETLSRQTAITANTTLNGAETYGISKYTPIDSNSDLVLTLDKGTHAVGQIHNFRKNGNGQVKFLRGMNVRLEGKRNIDNEHILINKGNFASLIWDRVDGSTLVGSVIGDIKGGYTGAVTTSSYSGLSDEATAQDVTVVGTGFSENMIVSLTGNATLNGWTFVNYNQVTLNITPSGAANDTLTVTYDNGDVFVDTDAITILSYNTDDLRHYYRLDADANDYKGTLHGTPNNIVFGSGHADFNGTDSNVLLPDADSLSYTDNTTDQDLSITFMVRFDTLGTIHVFSKNVTNSNGEYRLQITNSADLKFQCRQDNGGSYDVFDLDANYALAINTWYHIAIKKVGETGQFYIDGSPITTTATDVTGSYVSMKNNAADVYLGALSSAATTSPLNGQMKGFGFWNKALADSEVNAISTEQKTNNTQLL